MTITFERTSHLLCLLCGFLLAVCYIDHRSGNGERGLLTDNHDLWINETSEENSPMMILMEEGMHDDEGIYSDDQPLVGSRRLLNLKKEINKWKNKAKDAENKMNQYKNEATNLKNTVNNLNKQVSSLGSQVNQYKNQATDLQKNVNSLTGQLTEYKDLVRKLESEAKSTVKDLKLATEALKTIPQTLENEIVDPILISVKTAKSSLSSVDKIAKNLAHGTVAAIKKLNFLPKNGAELAAPLEDAMLNLLSSDFCVPYDCMAKKLGLDISDIELYSSENLSLGTSISPKTCVQITSIKFDPERLGNFLDLFQNLEILDDIFSEVTSFLDTEMKAILVHTKVVQNKLDDIESIANNAVKSLDVLRRRKLMATDDKEVPLTMEEAAAMAYEKGTARFHELYGEYVKTVFQERNLQGSARDYIAFTSLKMQFTQGLQQEFTLEAQHRSGFSGSMFDESFSKTSVVQLTPTPLFITASGSVSGAMPYTMIMDAEATASFTYAVEESITVDIVTGEVTKSGQPFTTDFDIDASVTVSGKIEMNLAASASLGLCFGPSDDACITVTVDASQSTGAGFDAMAELNLDETTSLTTLFTDKMEYKEQPNCDGQLAVSAGYWQYIEKPAVTVSLSGNAFCAEESGILYELEASTLQESIKSVCVAIDIL